MRTTRKALLAAVSSAAVWGSNAPVRLKAAAPVVQAKCGSTNVPTTDSLGIRNGQAWAAIEKESDGAVQVQFFTNDVLGSGPRQVDQLRLGALQFTLTGGLAMAPIAPIFTIEGVGFAFKDAQQFLRAYDGALGTRVRSEAARNGLIALGRFQNGASHHIMNSLRSVRTPEDLTNMKLRVTIAPVIIDCLNAMGATAVSIPGPEAFSAVQTHVVDGVATALENLYADKFYEIQKYLTLTNHAWVTYMMYANVDAWRPIPDKYKEIIIRNIDRYAALQRTDNIANQTSLVAKFKEKGMTVNAIDPAPFRARLGAYYAKYRETFGREAWTLLESSVGKLA